ncbi:MAG: hypothetical protein V4606_01665 [Patescibacteria group bacterium]
MTVSKQLLQVFPLAIIVIGLLSYNFMSAQWAAPTATAPNNNTLAPINTGISVATIQSAQGYLIFNRFAAANAVWSPQYCDATGDNCFTPSEVSDDMNLPLCTNGQTLVADATGTWICGTPVATPPPTSWLVNNQHSESQCTSLSGTVLTDGSGNKYCRFTRNSCPAGWAPHQNWAAYGVTTSTCGSGSCTSPARAWSNTAGAPSQFTSCRGINGSDGWTPFTCYSAKNQVGCY